MSGGRSNRCPSRCMSSICACWLPRLYVFFVTHASLLCFLLRSFRASRASRFALPTEPSVYPCLAFMYLWLDLYASSRCPPQIFKMLLRGKVSTLGEQYGDDQPVRLRSSIQQLQSIAEVARFNVMAFSSETPLKLIVIGGPPGVGKTRLGYEALALAVDRSRPLLKRLESDTGSPVLVVPIYISFPNGCMVQRMLGCLWKLG